MKRGGILLRTLGVLVIMLSFSGTPVMAAEPEPTDVSLSDIVIFNSLLVTNDFLAVVPYNIPFASAPTPNIDETFIFRLLSPDGLTELGTTLASPAYNQGYGLGGVSFYVSSSMSGNASYIFRVQQNPVYYPSPRYWDFIVGTVEYSTSSDQPAALRAKIIDMATVLNPSFGVALLATSEAGDTVLSTLGELYFLEIIPGLQAMSPDLFSVRLQDPDFTKRTWDTTFAEAMLTTYSGTFIGEFMTGYAGLYSLETSVAMNSLSVFFFILIISVSVWKFKATILSATLDGYTGLLLFMLTGFFSMIWAGFMAFVLAVVGGAIIWLKRA